MEVRSSFFVSAIAGLLALAGVVLHGQATQSSILGNITDAERRRRTQGQCDREERGHKPFKGKSQPTRMASTVSRDSNPGYNQVTVVARGFKTFEQTRIDLASAQIKRVDARLELGSIDTRVTVEGAASQVETETATLSNIKTGRDFAELTLSIYGRGWLNVTNVTAGVQSTSGFEVNGARYRQ